MEPSTTTKFFDPFVFTPVTARRTRTGLHMRVDLDEIMYRLNPVTAQETWGSKGLARRCRPVAAWIPQTEAPSVPVAQLSGHEARGRGGGGGVGERTGVDEGAAGGDHGAARLQDEGQAGARDEAPDGVHQVLRRRDGLTPAATSGVASFFGWEGTTGGAGLLNAATLGGTTWQRARGRPGAYSDFQASRRIRTRSHASRAEQQTMGAWLSGALASARGAAGER